MSISVCTLFEGNYHLGAGALINSLYQNGFRGTVYAGIRGPLPPWAQPVENDGEHKTFRVSNDLVVRFVPLATETHLANYKPAFMTYLLDTFLNSDDGLCYFDPDIVIKAPWEFFEEWITGGVMLVEDCTFPYMPSNHPLRTGWMRVAHAAGKQETRSLSRYYNSGFIGLFAKYREALTVWQEILQTSEKFGYDLKGFVSTNRSSLWQAADQDHLNAMLMVTDMPLTTVGPDGMDFAPAGYIMSHAVNAPKPWDKDYVRRAMHRGFRLRHRIKCTGSVRANRYACLMRQRLSASNAK